MPLVDCKDDPLIICTEKADGTHVSPTLKLDVFNEWACELLSPLMGEPGTTSSIAMQEVHVGSAAFWPLLVAVVPNRITLADDLITLVSLTTIYGPTGRGNGKCTGDNALNACLASIAGEAIPARWRGNGADVTAPTPWASTRVA